MARRMTLTPARTFKTENGVENGVAALNLPDDVRYMVVQNEEGRFYPVFVGVKAVEYGVHQFFVTDGGRAQHLGTLDVVIS